jgi:hypothetical protein
LHVCTDAEQEAKVNTEGSDVGAGFAAYPEYTKVAVVVEFDELAFVNGSNAELALDG